MGISEIVNSFLEKQKEKKAYEKQKIEDDRIEEKVKLKKLSPMERELEKYKKQEYDRKIESQVLKIRRQQKFEAEQIGTPKSTIKLFQESRKNSIGAAPNIFTKKSPDFKQKNIFSGKNIFVSKGGAKV